MTNTYKFHHASFKRFLNDWLLEGIKFKDVKRVKNPDTVNPQYMVTLKDYHHFNGKEINYVTFEYDGGLKTYYLTDDIADFTEVWLKEGDTETYSEKSDPEIAPEVSPAVAEEDGLYVKEVYRMEQQYVDNKDVKIGTIISSTWAGEFLKRTMGALPYESVYMLGMDTKNEIVVIREVFRGALNTSVAHPREIFQTAILNNCARVMIAHNHPSGNTEPSEADLNFTRRIVEAGEIIGIECIDHIIVGRDEFLSMREHGYM